LDLILITCSGRKISGGGKVSQSKSYLSNYIDSASFSRLVDLRRQINNLLPIDKRLAEGIDLGYDHVESTSEFMPAYKRYSGLLYESSSLGTLYPKSSSLKVIIISALYGILDADDQIRKYDWQMKCSLSSCVLTKTWWKNNRLGDLLFKVTESIKPDTIYDFLSQDYRLALTSWYEKNRHYQIELHAPGQGLNALRINGEILRNILLTHINQADFNNKG
jgi:cytoplasmic iron level regulating protein YaaA (DUF328/UPF0246 family)